MDPESIDEAIARDAYKAIEQLVTNKISSETIIQTILDSGLRGRGGGGFPTGLKWKFAYQNESDQKIYHLQCG